MFADRAKIKIRSGKGGDGHISFRREKFVPDGGPDGGNGGKGGDIIFEVDPGMNTLYNFRHKYLFAAGDGTEGGKKRQHGPNGKDLVLKVPNGTVIREFSSGKVIADMSGDCERKVILPGGTGGKGNMNYATSRMQAPRYAQPGKPSKEVEVLLELKLAADVGLVGLPNAGKSTFLSRVTNADPKIADYPFTTIIPNLGVVNLGYDTGFVIADIPGLIEGASEGQGLGHQFLRHVERTKVLIHLVDISGLIEDEDPVANIEIINNELLQHDPSILEKPMVIAANKIDVLPDKGEETIARIREKFGDKYKIFPISAVSGEGVNELLYAVNDILKKLPSEPVRFEQEFFPEIDLSDEENDYDIVRQEKGEEIKYIVEGPIIDKMLGYTNLESEKGFNYFQNFLKERGIIEALTKAGIKEGDTVKMYGHEFEYYEDDFNDE